VPKILSVTVSGKRFTVTGQNFDLGAAILINDKPAKKVSNDPDNPTTVLVSKKAGNTIDPGQTVTVVVRNSNGLTSDPFNFTRTN
jgi:IPT/TIG domain